MHTYLYRYIIIYCLEIMRPCWVGLVVGVSASRTVGCEFASPPGHTKDHHKNGTNFEFDSEARMSKRPGNVWNFLWGHALKRSPGIIRKSRVSYPGPGFLSSATWPSLPKKYYNGLNQTKPEIMTASITQKLHPNACNQAKIKKY